MKSDQFSKSSLWSTYPERDLSLADTNEVDTPQRAYLSPVQRLEYVTTKKRHQSAHGTYLSGIPSPSYLHDS